MTDRRLRFLERTYLMEYRRAKASMERALRDLERTEQRIRDNGWKTQREQDAPKEDD